MGNFFGTPLIASEHGMEVDQLTWLIHGLMAVLFVGWLTYFIYVLLRFRRSRNPQANHAGVKNHLSTYIEGGVALAEAALLIGLAVPIWARAVDKFPSEQDSTVIDVMARQFNWTARYAGPDGVFGARDPKLVTSNDPFGVDRNSPGGKDDIIVVNDLVAPVNKPVIARITSLDVIHSFAIRPMRVTQDAIPGMMIPAHFKPVKTGLYPINCVQLCGNSHYAMKGNFTVLSAEDFKAWEQSKAQAPAEAGSYE